MIKGYDIPLKVSAHMDIVEPFKKHITSQYGPNDWNKVQDVIMEIQKQRQLLDYSKLSAQISNDYRLCEEIELRIIQYIKYINMIDNIFKSAFNAPKNPLKCNFGWNDTFNPGKKALVFNSSKYELICALYNLAAIYHTDASCLCNGQKEEDKIKAVSKLQRAYWCLAEIKQQIPQLLTDPKYLPMDLDPTYLTVLSNYFVGLAYNILISILTTRNTNETKLASTNKAAAQSFQVAFDLLNANAKFPYPEFVSKKFKAILLYYAVMHRSQAYDYISKMHLKLVDDELLKGHMGLAVSYLRLAKNDLENLLNKKDYYDKLTPQQKEEINLLAKNIFSNHKIYKEKNDRIYHQPEFDVNKLPEIPDETKAIQPLEPKDIKSRLDQEKLFEGFLSPEVLALRQEILNLISLKLLEFENSVKNAIETKNKVYSQGGVNYLIDLINTPANQKADIPPQILEKIEKFHKNGGVQNYERIKQYVSDSAKKGLDVINEIKTMLANEKAEDDRCRQQYPKEWNRPIAEQLNVEYVFQLKDLEQKYMVAQNMDQQITKKYGSSYEWMKKLSQPREVIANMIPKNLDSNFMQEKKIELMELSSMNKQLEQMIGLEQNRQLGALILEEFLKSDYIQTLNGISFKKLDKTKEFDRMLEQIKQKLDTLTNKIKEGYVLMDEISSKAKDLNAHKSNNSQSAVRIIEEITYNINIINEIYDEFMQGTNFYNNLTIYLNNLQKIVADYCFARDIDKQNRLQEIEAQKNYSHFNNPEPFYSEKTGQFPQGVSEFRPASNAQQTYQGLAQSMAKNCTILPNNPTLTGTSFGNVNHLPGNQPQQPIYQQSQIKPSIYQQQPQPTSIYQQPPQEFIVSSQYGYMPFNNANPPVNNNANANNNNQGGTFAGFSSTTSTFVSDPFSKK